jgi:hypothetical protein
MSETIQAYLNGDTNLKEVVICTLDSREEKSFEAKM